MKDQVKPNVKNAFTSNTSDWFGEKNDIDCCFRQIPDSIKNDVRQNFGIGFNEDIIFVRDTGFWNNRDQGLVITNEAIYCIPDNDNPDQKIYLPWNILKNVVYRDMVLYFFGYGGEDDNCPIHISYFTKSSDETKQVQVGRRLATILTGVCNLFTPPKDPLDEVCEKYDKLKEEGKNEEALQLALEAYNAIEGADFLCYYISNDYRGKKDYQQALKYCDLAMANAEVGSFAYVMGMYQKESIYAVDMKDYIQSRKYAFLAAKYATTEKRNDGVLVKDDAKSDFDICEDYFVKEFLAQPYNKRKILMPVREYVDLSQNHIAVVNIKNLPDVQFPIGHPIANQLYVGHPYLPQKYIPFENYQLELIEDKVREFCQIAQCLGATEISIDAENAMQSSSSRNVSQNGEGGVDYKLISAKGSGKRNRSSSLIDEISQAINLHQTFMPTKKPFLPENTVWYQNEPSWQRLYEQRMNGGLSQHEERIETRKSQVADNHELTELKAELQYLFVEANMSWNTSMDEKFSQQENAVLSIKVTFAPIDSIGNNEAVAPLLSSSSPSFTKTEQEYLDNIKEFLEDDAEITPRERRMLDRIRQSLGISEERAKELESSLAPQLTEDEQEYLDMYNDYASKGEITDKERRRLDKFAVALGIEEGRIKEIEQLSNIV
ncbi:MAG: hypothetical protein J5971_03105 [Prevotella sp.]|nr:hypothetical protein [Prevotella sp.]